MNNKSQSLQFHARSFASALVFLVCTGAVWADTYNPVTKELTVPVVTIGAATFFNMVVTVGPVVRGPTGDVPNGSEDAYDTASSQLTVPTVTVGNATYHNVVATVASVVSLGSTGGGMDVYDGTNLGIYYVQTGSTIYHIVAITIGSVVSVGTGLPTFARDVYDPASNHLTIAAVQVGSNVYTNVIVTVGTIVHVGSKSPPVSQTLFGMNWRCAMSCLYPQTVHMINSGTAIRNISSVTVQSPIAGGQPVFTESNNCPASLGVAQSCAITVSFGSPNIFVNYAGTLLFAHDAAGSPQTVKLSGFVQ